MVEEVSWLGVVGRGTFPAFPPVVVAVGLASHSCGGSAGLAVDPRHRLP